MLPLEAKLQAADRPIMARQAVALAPSFEIPEADGVVLGSAGN
jgi:hypothetical protein